MRAATKALGRTLLTGAVAALVAGSVPLAGATVSSGDRPIYVPITPCRLFDTRPSATQIGPRSTPIGHGETFTLQVRGAVGNCTIPAGAVGVAMNTTVVNGTEPSFLTVHPADAPKPLAASLNWIANQPPTPNQLIVALAADGRISLFNFAGRVDVVGDVVGYFEAHDFDDRYYTKAQIEAAYYTKAQIDAGYYTKAQIDGATTTRSVSFPAEGLNVLANGNIQKSNGLIYQNTTANEAGIGMHRPRDYVLSTPVTLRIFFQPLVPAAPAGTTVGFYSRPRDHNPGDPETDAVGVQSNLVAVSGMNEYEATIVFPATELDKQWWYVTVSRDCCFANGYTGIVKVHNVELSYTAYVDPPG